MPLFQPSVLKQQLKLQDETKLNQAYKKYTKYFLNPTIQDNIRSSKEEEYQGIFLTELFVNILGYTLKPKADFNLVAEYKNENNARKADGAILNNNVAIGVIELKGTNTKDLEGIRKQAFDYKANQKGCVYVVTSNFEKLRFYINDATEFEEFNLFELSPKRFTLLYLCLQKDNIIYNVPLKIKEASLVEEEQITKQFYKDYSLFKRELYRDLVKRNAKTLKTQASLRVEAKQSLDELSEEEKAEQLKLEKNVKLTLFKKSQKLIDRYLFIFFAEDRGLLPPNSTQQILDKWKDDVEFGDDRPLYTLFKQYFNFLDQGRAGTSKRAEIYAYNGGLFKEDKTLDSLEIDSDLLYKHTSKLAAYDFESQVDVNILGHIFENSLNEIESVNAEIEGGDFDKQKSKRKKDGVFYTPKYITKYIVENTVGKLCDEKKTELDFKEEEYFKGRKINGKNRPESTIKKLVTILDTYRDWLLQLTICDPACGSGAFLNQALDFLIKEHTYIDELKTKVLGGGLQFSDIENTILENNIYGVDLNEESVEIAKLSLWLRTAQPRRKLNDLSSNIKCGNSLIDNKAVAGDKAFNWQEQFPQVFKAKEKKIYHVTTAIHDSRTSKRMEKYKVRELRDMGTNPYPNVIYFTPEDDFLISKTIAEIVKEDDLKVLAYNICADHMHLLLACDIDDIPAIMQKIKGRTSFVCNKANKEEFYKGLKPLAEEEEKNKPLWQQKYSAPKEVKTTEQLYNTIKYIQTNRTKHELPKHNKDVQNLIDSLTCTEAQAFKTEHKGGFDVVIGNPPYVPTEYINPEDKIFLERNYQSAFGRINLYPIFYEKGILLLRNKGVLGYITPYTILKNKYYKSARNFILNESKIHTLIDFKGTFVFIDAAVDSIILILEKSKDKYDDFEQISNVLDFQSGLYTKTKVLLKEVLQTEDLSLVTSIFDKIIKRVSKNSIPMKEVVNFNQGIITGSNKKYITYEASELTKPVITGSDFNRYILYNSNQLIIYDTEKLHRPRKKEIFEVEERLILRQTGAYPICTLEKQMYYTLDTVHNGLLINNSFKIKYVLGLLNSRLFRFLYENSINESGKVFAQVKIMYVDPLPIKKVNDVLQEEFSKSIDLILNFNLLQSKIITSFLSFVTNQYNLESISRKLKNWYNLDFREFIKELNKAIKKSTNPDYKGFKSLAKKEEFEWLDLFEENKQKAQALQTQINQTDAEIDAMVYELYGLSTEEISIVENA